jgi:carotenoid cleavage dioxygenase-like enzyme
MLSAMDFKTDDTTKIHAVATDGSGIETFDTGIFFQMIHTGNSFMRDDGTLVVDATTYDRLDANVYELFDFSKLRTEEDLLTDN